MQGSWSLIDQTAFGKPLGAVCTLQACMGWVFWLHGTVHALVSLTCFTIFEICRAGIYDDVT